jgi:YD repeat-containing protein
VTTTTLFDPLNRPTSRTYSDGTPSVSYTYDDPAVARSKGRVTRVGSSVSTTHYDEYDVRGRIKQTRQETAGVTYTMGYGYDLADNLTSQSYPSGRLVSTSYDAAGRVGGVHEGALAYASQFLG